MLSFVGITQRLKETKSNATIGHVSCNYVEEQNVNTGDTMYYVTIGFKSRKSLLGSSYQTIILQRNQISTLIENLKQVRIEMVKKVNKQWKR